MKRQVLIFDLDGTLIDSRRDLAAGINLMRRHYGLLPLPVETVTGFVGEGIRNLVTRSLADAPFAVDLEESVRLDTKFYRQHLHDDTVLYPGVREGLDCLAAAGHALALLTNKPGAASREILRHFEIEALFASIIGGDSGIPLKPEPEAVFAILRTVNGTPANTWMIGDNHTDIAVAHRAGIHSIFTAYGFGKLRAETPERTVAGFDEVTRMFCN
ncbi:MAG: HAD-IA family hydrolase [Kiritimatiellae bacterium]|nr:HAD-IA family hydrolase [Kiritimatiellia bacterium]